MGGRFDIGGLFFKGVIEGDSIREQGSDTWFRDILDGYGTGTDVSESQDWCCCSRFSEEACQVQDGCFNKEGYMSEVSKAEVQPRHLEVSTVESLLRKVRRIQQYSGPRRPDAKKINGWRLDLKVYIDAVQLEAKLLGFLTGGTGYYDEDAQISQQDFKKDLAAEIKRISHFVLQDRIIEDRKKRNKGS